jgi:hypothetical protein
MGTAGDCEGVEVMSEPYEPYAIVPGDPPDLVRLLTKRAETLGRLWEIAREVRGLDLEVDVFKRPCPTCGCKGLRGRPCSLCKHVAP